jgi:transposase
MLADELDHVVGVDTHRDQHVLAVVVVPTGAVVAQRSVPATAHGYAAALRFADEFAPGRRLWAIEGAGHYGAGLARHLAARNEMVHESARSTRAERRLRGKDDPLDAIRAARSVIGTGTRATPRSGERQEALRVLMVARRSAVDVRRVALVQLRSVIVTAPETLREELRLLPVTELVRRCSRFRRSNARTPDHLATVLALRSLAQRIQTATQEAALLEREILAHVRALAPELLDEAGVGPIVAAQLIVSWSHKDRVRSEAAFARLAGVAPLPASSGLTNRHRLSRGGDRQLNRALHAVILHRRQHDPQTKRYIDRRVAEGKTRRDATRLLKRYLARHLYRVMQNAKPLTT